MDAWLPKEQFDEIKNNKRVIEATWEVKHMAMLKSWKSLN